MLGVLVQQPHPHKQAEKIILRVFLRGLAPIHVQTIGDIEYLFDDLQVALMRRFDKALKHHGRLPLREAAKLIRLSYGELLSHRLFLGLSLSR
jgi:hypothetical protein